MMNLVGEISLFLIIGLIIGFVIGWMFFDNSKLVLLESENNDYCSADRDLENRLRNCEEAVRKGAPQ